MFIHILNYSIRLFFLVFGTVLLLGWFPPERTEGGLFQILGGVFIFWGVYRTITYYFHLKRMKLQEKMELLRQERENSVSE
jgi:hypothetical protein